MKLSRILLALAAAVAFSACSDSGTGGDNTGGSFSRKAMLQQVAEGYIIPSYTAFDAQAKALHRAAEAFADNPTEQTLASARAAWDSAAHAYQWCFQLDFGPAESFTGTLSENVATFPASAEKIEAKITAADTVFADFNRDNRGLMAVEYLLFANSPQEVVTRFGSAEGSARKAYLRSLTREIAARAASVLSAWDSYKATFIASDGSNAGSSISLLFNRFSYGFEVMKNFKVGVPAGKRAGQTDVEPTRVEAYHSGRTTSLLREHHTAVKALWQGIGRNGAAAGDSFKQYLAVLTGGPALAASTEQQFAAIDDALAALGTEKTFSALVGERAASVDNLHTEMQKLTRFVKSELSSVLGVAITYSSGDGD